MENPQAQMPQGQPGPAQQGGDDQMQQIMQYVQQSVQQGAQPVDVAIQLIQQGAQPEMIMQVFVQMGMPEDQAREAIETAMEGGQPMPATGEGDQLEDASNPDAEMAEEGDMPVDQPGDLAQQMAFGGSPRRALKKYANGAAVDPNQELQSVMQQVQEMMDGGADARQVMQQIQAAAQQGQISPEVATSVMEQLQGMQQAENPQGSDAAMMAQSQDPQQMDPNMAVPDSPMMKFGGNLKKLMSKAYGGNMTPPSIDSKTYAQDRAAMFVGAVKNNAFKSTLDDEFPSLVGNKMAYGGDIPKAVDGFDVTKYKTADEAELAAYRYRNTLAPEEQAKFDVGATLKNWKQPEPTYEAGKNYQYDPATKSWKAAETPAANTVQANSQLNPVGYPNPNMGLYGNLYAGASPFARLLANSGNYNLDPRITGANLPGGMSAQQFLGAAGPNGLVPGMSGTIGDQTWRIGEAEKFKEGSIWKGNRRKGVRYQIDWGSQAAMNPNAPQPAMGPQNQPVVGPQNQPAPAPAAAPTAPVVPSVPTAPVSPAAATPAVSSTTSVPAAAPPTNPYFPGENPADDAGWGLPSNVQPNNYFAGENPSDDSGWGLPKDPNAPVTQSVNPSMVNSNPAPDNPMNVNSQFAQNYINSAYGDIRSDLTGTDQQALDQLITNGANQNQIDESVTAILNNRNLNLSQANQNAMQPPVEEFPSLATAPTAVNTADQTLVNPATTDVINPSSEVNPVDQNVQPQAVLPQATQLAAAPASPRITVPPVKPKPVSQNPPVTPPTTPKKGNNPWDQDKSSNWYVPKNDDAGFAEFKKTNPKIPNPNAPRWGKGGTEEQLKAAHLQAIKNAQTRMATFNSQQQKQQQANRNSNANLNSYGYGGGVDPAALENAVALINRAFGGMIPRADNGLNLGTQDTDTNNIPDYLQFNTWQEANPDKGSIEASNAQKLNIDWNAAGDMYMSGAGRLTNFMNKARANDPNRTNAKYSALNTASNTYDQMKQGLYDQAGNFIPNDIGNQVLNPTNTYYSNQRPIFAYGGKVYEIGGDVELDDNEMQELAAAGFKFSRI
jgi:hypothetical protein